MYLDCDNYLVRRSIVLYILHGHTYYGASIHFNLSQIEIKKIILDYAKHALPQMGYFNVCEVNLETINDNKHLLINFINTEINIEALKADEELREKELRSKAIKETNTVLRIIKKEKDTINDRIKRLESLRKADVIKKRNTKIAYEIIGGTPFDVVVNEFNLTIFTIKSMAYKYIFIKLRELGETDMFYMPNIRNVVNSSLIN